MGRAWIPSVELVLDLHEQIVEEGDITEPGVRSENAIESALQYVSDGYFGEVPQTLDDKAVHPLGLLVADHPFVDGNKRTALRSVVVFYMINGYTFDYGDEVRALLHRFANDEAELDMSQRSSVRSSKPPVSPADENFQFRTL